MYYIKFGGWNGNATIYEFEKKVEIINIKRDSEYSNLAFFPPLIRM